MEKKERTVVYLPHPVTPEMKATVLASGGRIIDAQFAPPDAEHVMTAEQMEHADAQLKEQKAKELAAAAGKAEKPAK